ncbi:hypothetical protein F5890DRAFT_1476966 [Lentinula detonsa]|uniref:Uncharacterized protein n=1 Tax=Lentinula detonsa TaxID=2804962 RepID=A0AA38PT57_9AGAR|nr:hypothetical protein F5890DRAFT_1476966 [Lentinula detonsa]
MQRQLQSRIGAPFSGIPPPMVSNYSDQRIVVKATVRPKLYEIGVVTSKGVCSLGEAVLDVSQVVWQCYHIPSTQRTPDPFLGTIAFKRTLSRQEFKSELARKLPFHFQGEQPHTVSPRYVELSAERSANYYEYESIGNANISNLISKAYIASHQDNANLPSAASQLSMGNPVLARVLLSTRIKVTSLAASNNVSGCILGGHTSQALCSNEVHFIGQTEAEKDRVLMTVCAGSVVLVCVVSIVTRLAEVLFVHDKSPHQTEGVTATIVRASPDENILPVFEMNERQKECTWYRGVCIPW